jgi:polyisoprenoid-binding protein YceI
MEFEFNTIKRRKKMSDRISKFAIAAVLAGGLSLPSYTQAQSRKIDSSHSDARLSMDGTIGSPNQTITLGAARVSGTMNLDKDNLTKSTFTFSVYPASSPSASIDPNGKPTSGDASDIANYTLVSFQSERVSMTSDGNLKVTGKMTITSVNHEADLTWSEAYAGPANSTRVVEKSTHEESFIFAIPPAAVAEFQRNAKVQFSGSADVNREDFPQLVNAILATNWPPVVRDERCEMPAMIGEDYAGASCTGDALQVPARAITSAGIGEDYPGPDAASAQLGNKLTILVHLQLTEEQPQLSAKADE